MIVVDDISPLASGAALFDSAGNRRATLGALTVDRANGRFFGLTTTSIGDDPDGTVARGSSRGFLEPLGRIMRPPVSMPGERRSITERVAFIEFNPSGAARPGAGREPAEPIDILGESVVRIGGRSTPTAGTVITVQGVVRLPTVAFPGGEEFLDAIEVEGTGGAPFATDGDGGALVVSHAGVPVGVVVAVGSQTCFVAPLNIALARLGMDLLSPDFQLRPAMLREQLPVAAKGETARRVAPSGPVIDYGPQYVPHSPVHDITTRHVRVSTDRQRLTKTVVHHSYTITWLEVRNLSHHAFDVKIKSVSRREVFYAFGVRSGVAAANVDLKSIKKLLASATRDVGIQSARRGDTSSSDINKMLDNKPVTLNKSLRFLSNLERLLGERGKHSLDNVILDAAVWIIEDRAVKVVNETLNIPSVLSKFDESFVFSVHSAAIEKQIVHQLLAEISRGFSITGWMSGVIKNAFGSLGMEMSFYTAASTNQNVSTPYRPAKSERLVLRELGGDVVLE